MNRNRAIASSAITKAISGATAGKNRWSNLEVKCKEILKILKAISTKKKQVFSI